LYLLVACAQMKSEACNRRKRPFLQSCVDPNIMDS
jgi:hypothetical protein